MFKENESIGMVVHHMLQLLNVSDDLDKAERVIFRTLYGLASFSFDQYKELFPHCVSQSLPRSMISCLDEDFAWENHSTFTKQEQANHDHKGRNCGNKFNPGEPIYRCLDCGFDATCVLCVHCFNKDDHSGHKVVSNICSEANSGICDCGDPEAWTQELHCKAEINTERHSKKELEFDPELGNRLEEIYSILLNYVLEIFSHQTQTLPVVRNSLLKLSETELLKTLKNAYQVSKDVFDLSDLDELDSKQFSLVFWNDEFHNFDEARSGIRSAANVTQDMAIPYANTIDRVGRCQVKTEKKIEDLLKGLSNTMVSNFTASIISTDELRMQNLCEVIFRWFSNSINLPNSRFQSIARMSFCKALCKTYQSSIASPYFDLSTNTYELYSGLLFNGRLPSPTDPLNKNHADLLTMENATVLQYLLYFDIRYWKRLRKSIREILIPILVSDLTYKRIASKQIIEIYPLLIKNLALLDREPHLNMLTEIATQFYTCPTNSTDIVNDSLSNVLKPIYEILKPLVKTTNSDSAFIFPKKVDDLSQSKRNSIKRSLQDLQYIFDKATTLEPLYKDENLFFELIEIIGIFERCSKLKRKSGAHIESESFEFVSYLNIWYSLIRIITIITDISKVHSIDNELLIAPIKNLIHVIIRNHPIKLKSVKNYDILDFQVATGLESMINPQLTLLSRLISLYASSTKSIKNIIDDDVDFLALSDYSLRSIVMSSQIDCQFWIRNGQSASAHSSAYKGEMFMKESAYLYDLSLIQDSLLVSDPSRCILNIIERFDLMNWFNNQTALTETIYDDKIELLIEKFIAFLYSLLTYRDNFIKYGTKEDELDRAYRNVLIYNLFSGPKPYSDLEDLVEEDDSFNSDLFEKVLNKVSNFNAPKGLNDDGKYSLKPELMKSVDPLHTAAQSLDYNKSLTSLAKSAALTSEEHPSWEEIVIPPIINKLENYPELGAFTRTFEFAKLVSKLLDYVISEEKESFAPVLLHLIHAVILDNEQVNGVENILESFTHVPICEHLFSITSNANFTKHLRTKADFILSSLIFKDSENLLESLTACFGVDQIENYKEQKKNAGVNFDETESEKKRRLAKERQKKIMDRMKKKQKAFLDKNNSSENQESKDSNKEAETDSNTCVLCQGTGNVKEFLCSPLSVTKTQVLRRLYNNESNFSRGYLNWENDSIENSLNFEGIVPEISDVRVAEVPRVGSSCNHLVHYKCLKNYLNGENSNFTDISCPLCKTKHDTYVPSVGDLSNVDDEIISGKSKKSKSDLFYHSIIESDSNDEGPSILDYLEILNINFKHFKASENDAKLTILTGSILSNSIQQAEISTRINGREIYYEFLNLIPEQTYKTFRLLVKYFVFLEEPVIGGLSEKAFNSGKKKDFMTCFILDFFLGTKDFNSVAIKWLRAFVEVYTGFIGMSIPGYFVSIDSTPEKVSSQEFKIYASFFQSTLNKVDKAPGEIVKPDIIKMFSKIKKNLLTDVRNLLIFYKVLKPEFEINLNKEEEFSIDLILKSLNLPTFLDILKIKDSSAIKPKQVDTLPYPGVIKLVDLPKDLSYFASTIDGKYEDRGENGEIRFPALYMSTHNRIDYCICLVCGQKFLSKLEDEDDGSCELKCHMNGGSIRFYPSTNIVKIVCKKNSKFLTKKINAPYLNSHGQSGFKAIQHGHNATLNVERYKFLNNLFLTGGIYPYLSRNSSTRRRMDNVLENIIDTVVGQDFRVQQELINRDTVANLFQQFQMNGLNLGNGLMALGGDDSDSDEEGFEEFDQNSDMYEDDEYFYNFEDEDEEGDDDDNDENDDNDDDDDEDADDWEDDDDDSENGFIHSHLIEHIISQNPGLARAFGLQPEDVINGLQGIPDSDYEDDDDEDDEEFFDVYNGTESEGDFESEDFDGMEDDEILEAMNTVSFDVSSDYNSEEDADFNPSSDDYDVNTVD